MDRSGFASPAPLPLSPVHAQDLTLLVRQNVDEEARSLVAVTATRTIRRHGDAGFPAEDRENPDAATPATESLLPAARLENLLGNLS
jgi:hypothetical protein